MQGIKARERVGSADESEAAPSRRYFYDQRFHAAQMFTALLRCYSRCSDSLSQRKTNNKTQERYELAFSLFFEM